MKEALDKLMPDTSKMDIAGGVAAYFGTAGNSGDRARALNEYVRNLRNEKFNSSKTNTELAVKMVDSYNSQTQPPEAIKTLNAIYSQYAAATPKDSRLKTDQGKAEIWNELWEKTSGGGEKAVQQLQKSLLIQNATTINNNISRYKELVNQEKDKEGKTISYTDQSGKKQKWTPAIENEYGSLKENLKTIYQMPDARKVNFFNWPKDIVNESNIKETKADGGRIGYATGGEVNPNPDHGNPRGFTNLRAKLPPTISNDVVRLISSSDQAYLDFAQIQKVGDVAKFNNTYGTNLTLPIQASNNTQGA